MKRHTALSMTAALLASSLLLTACGSGEIVVDEPHQSEAAQSAPNLDVQRIAEMLREAQASFDAAEQADDLTLLEKRMSDPALRMRQAQHNLAKKSNATLAPLDLTEQLLTVTNATKWPRVVLDLAKPAQGNLPAIYLFVQDDARSEYKLQNWTRLLGSAKFSTFSVEEGTPYLEPDATGFIMTPKEAVAGYVAMLNSGTAGSDTFTADEFTLNYFSTLEHLKQSVTAAGTVTAQATEGEFPITAVRLADGSALVASAITFSHTYDRTIARSTMKLGGSPAILAGDPNVVGTATANYLLTILIYVPVEGSQAKASLVGVERALESVSKDDAAKPQGE